MYSLESIKGLVSVVIPAYNAAAFIVRTIESVLAQSYGHLEVIVIDDGSTDATASSVEAIGDSRLHFHRQSNKGVSAARNKGFSFAKGEFVVFFDADDIMAHDFLVERVRILQEFDLFDYSCGMVRKLDEENHLMDGLLKSACVNVKEEVLTFDPFVVTCPSSYLFRRDALVRNKLVFNEALSSTADRYFLLEVDRVLVGCMLRAEASCLYYRFHRYSMSNALSNKLIVDNQIYFGFVVNKIRLDARLKRLFLAKSNYVLAGANFRTGNWWACHKFTLLSVFYSPSNFFRTLFKWT